MAAPRILVVGSVNMDLVTQVHHVPAAAENVRGDDIRSIPGGKGANQAAACARLGALTSFLGRVGDDAFGERLRRNLADCGVDTESLATVPGAASGVALILVDAAGQNTIVVTPGANARLSPADVDAERRLVAEADAVLLQLEIPPETVARTLQLARHAGTLAVVDAGPPRGTPEEALFACDVLSPNQAEAATLLGLNPAHADPETMAAELLDRGPRAVVLKAAQRGAVVADHNGVRWAPPFRIDPVDTTAAGDAFTAALTVEIVKGATLDDAARVANAAGAFACTRLGAQPSMPTADDVAAILRSEV